MQNKLISDVCSRFYMVMDMTSCTPAKLQLLLSFMISVKCELHDMGVD